MTSPLLSVSDLKTYLGLTGSGDDTLLGQCIDDAQGVIERDTGRRFAASSNVRTVYSTDGQASLVVHDRPYTDPSRVVTLSGTTLTEDTDVWFLPDRRNPDISTTVQFRHYDPAAYRREPMWFDRNLDRPRAQSAVPNDLVVTGIIGHPFPTNDVIHQMRVVSAWFYYRAKSGASGVVTTPTGEEIDVSEEPKASEGFIRNWRIRTAVSAV